MKKGEKQGLTTGSKGVNENKKTASRNNGRDNTIAGTPREERLKIEMRLTEAMRGGAPVMPSLSAGKRLLADKPPIGPSLIEDIADWGIWMRGRNGSAGSEEWYVKYLRWALLGRCREFMDYCRVSDHPRASEAIQAVQKVYGFEWPHNSTCGYIFHYIWGWLQLELEEPGECKPMSIQEQKEVLEKTLKESGTPILEWHYDGFGGVKAVTCRTILPQKEGDKKSRRNH